MQDLQSMIKTAWDSNQFGIYFVTEESWRVWDAANAAAKELSADQPEAPVQVWAHDKVSGFYRGQPKLEAPKDQSHIILKALPRMLQPGVTEPFDGKADILFVVKDPAFDLNESQYKAPVIQIIRNAIAANMASPDAFTDNGTPLRGKRLFLFVTPVEKKPEDLPELDPVVIPLPDDEMLGKGLDETLKELIGKKNRFGQTIQNPDPDERRRILAVGRGFTYQKWTDVLSYAITVHGGANDVEAFIRTIREKKQQMVKSIPGMELRFCDTLPPAMPGYEPVMELVRRCARIDPALAARHKLKPFKGVLFCGLPGTGKTVGAEAVAREAGLDCLFVSLGEIQSQYVGASEQRMRKALLMGEAMQACLVFDDIDKAGAGVAKTGHTGDGGAFGRMINMILTDLSRADRRCVVVFTANRPQNLPPELVRVGRVDKQYIVDLPNAPTRHRLFTLFLEYHGLTLSDPGMVDQLAGAPTDGWTGNEIRALIEDLGKAALAEGTTVIDAGLMADQVRLTVPMSKQEVYRDDLAQMAEAGEQFIHIGCIKENERTTAPPTGRASRKIRS